MATNHTGPAGALVIDANVMIAFTAHETGRDTLVTTEFNQYALLGYSVYAPGAIITETLYALCQKLNTGSLTPESHNAAIRLFELTMQSVLPPPNGEAALITRAEEVRQSYGCSRSADSVYMRSPMSSQKNAYNSAHIRSRFAKTSK